MAQNDDVTNNKVLVVNRLGGALRATDDIDLILLDLLSEEQELLFLAPIAKSLNQASKKNSDENRRRVNPNDGIGEEGEDKGGQAKGGQHNHVELVELVEQDIPEGAHCGQ